jgi:4-hydroxybenzoate polyprenyltransferase
MPAPGPNAPVNRPGLLAAAAAIGHLAAWAGLYVAAAVVCCAQLIGMRIQPRIIAYAWATAVAAYLLDRLKLWPAWIDPADRIAHPARYAFLEDHSAVARILMAATWAASAALAWIIQPLLIAATISAATGVLVYAGRPRHRSPDAPRVKDVFILKNLFVGAGIAGFALIVALLAQAPASGLWPSLVEQVRGQPMLLGLVGSHLLVRVFADAVLCDIDDEASDRAHATETLPTRIGGNAAWRIAMWLRLALAASLLAWPVGPWRARVAWAAVTALSTIALRVWRPRRVRDVVDGRFAIEAALVVLSGG